MAKLDNQHSIKTLLFDLIFSDQQRAQELYDEVRHLHYQELETIICDCLDQFNQTDEVIQIDTLEIDLGPIHYDDLQPQLALKIMEALLQKLSDILRGYDTAKARRSNDSPVQLESLRYFLQRGYLPWNSQINAATLIEQCLESEPEETARLVRWLGQQAKVRQRIVQRFDVHTVQRLLQAMDPQNGALIRQYLNTLHEQVAKLPNIQSSKAQLAIQLNLFFLNSLILTPRSAFRLDKLVRQSLQQLVQHYDLNFLDTVQVLQQELQPSVSAAHRSIRQILAVISDDLRPTALVTGHQARRFGQMDKVEQRQLLLQYLRGEAMVEQVFGLSQSGFERVLLGMLDDEAEPVFKLLQHNRFATSSIEKIIHFFDKKVIHKIIRTIEPGHSQTIINFQNNVLYVHRREPVVQSSEQKLSDTIWQIILRNLLFNTGTYFNQKAFLKHLIARMAAHYNLNYIYLLQQLRRTAASVATQTARFPLFMQLISEIFEDEELSLTPEHQVARTATQTTKEKDPATLFAALLRQSGTSSGQTESSEREILRDFIAQYPKIARRMMRQELIRPATRQKLARLSHGRLFLRIIQLLQPEHQPVLAQAYRVFIRTAEKLKAHIPQIQHFEYFIKTAILAYLAESGQMGLFSEGTLYEQLLQDVATNFQVSPQRLRENLVLPSVFNPQQERNPKRTIALEDLLEAACHLTPVTADFWQVQGFANQNEALEYLSQYQAKPLLRQLRKLSIHQLETLSRSVSAATMLPLLSVAVAGQTAILHLLDAIDHRLKDSGFHQRSAVLHHLQKVVFQHLIKIGNQANLGLFQSMERVLLRYALPRSFYALNTAWKAPARGDMRQPIQQLENQINRSVRQAERPSSAGKLLLEELFEKAKVRSKGIPYFTEKEPEIFESMFINNAGLVILQAYLPFFFERCDLFEDREFKSTEAARRAALLLQYVAFETTTFEEEDLVLNKVLCGLSTEEVLPSEIELTENEKETAKQMLQAIISHWEMVKNSSIEGFQQSWLWREGKLERQEKYWELTIEKRAFDILLDYAPFGLSPVKFSWMELPITVIWR